MSSFVDAHDFSCWLLLNDRFINQIQQLHKSYVLPSIAFYMHISCCDSEIKIMKALLSRFDIEQLKLKRSARQETTTSSKMKILSEICKISRHNLLLKCNFVGDFSLEFTFYRFDFIIFYPRNIDSLSLLCEIFSFRKQGD